MFFRQGHRYMGGADVPFFVSNSMIVSGAKGEGFEQVQLFERDKFPISNLPPIPPGTENDWNTVITGLRVAPDGNVEAPPGVRWVVDVTPAPFMVAAGTPVLPPQLPPPGQPSIPPEWSGWIPAPPTAPHGGPESTKLGGVSKEMQMPLLVGIGVLGGAFLGWQGLKHMFGEGLTSEERKNILVYGASILAVWGLSRLVELEKIWWLTPEGVEQKAKQEMGI